MTKAILVALPIAFLGFASYLLIAGASGSTAAPQVPAAPRSSCAADAILEMQEKFASHALDQVRTSVAHERAFSESTGRPSAPIAEYQRRLDAARDKLRAARLARCKCLDDGGTEACEESSQVPVVRASELIDCDWACSNFSADVRGAEWLRKSQREIDEAKSQLAACRAKYSCG